MDLIGPHLSDSAAWIELDCIGPDWTALDFAGSTWMELDRILSDWAASDGMVLHSLRAAERTEESVSLLERVLGQTDAHTEEVKRRAKV